MLSHFLQQSLFAQFLVFMTALYVLFIVTEAFKSLALGWADWRRWGGTGEPIDGEKSSGAKNNAAVRKSYQDRFEPFVEVDDEGNRQGRMLFKD
jgi:hypothetical protein